PPVTVILNRLDRADVEILDSGQCGPLDPQHQTKSPGSFRFEVRGPGMPKRREVEVRRSGERGVAEGDVRDTGDSIDPHICVGSRDEVPETRLEDETQRLDLPSDDPAVG